MRKTGKLIILDRDGVINLDSDNYIKTVDEWQEIPGSVSAIADFKAAGYIVAIATNQSGIARHYFDLNTLAAMHQKLNTLLLRQGAFVDAILFCPHGPSDHCECRKPKAGLLHRIKNHFRLPLENVYAVGDSLRDLQAAEEVGAKPILVKTGKGTSTLQNLKNKNQYPIFDDLRQASRAILSQQV